MPLKAAIEKAAEQDGTSMNQFLVVAAAEKLPAMQTEAYFAERGARRRRAPQWQSQYPPSRPHLRQRNI